MKNFLIYVEKKIKPSVNIFPIEGHIINFIEFCNSFQNAAHYFFKYSLINQDILLVPLIKSSHYVLIVFLKKYNLIIYLNSVYSDFIHRKEIIFILEVLQFVNETKNIAFDNNWKLYIAKDLPQQYNMHDCAEFMYVCFQNFW